jgi:hypothetical protein
VHTWHANLDGDAHRELVQLVKNGSIPNGHRWLRVVDRAGGQLVFARISPRVEFLTASDVKVEDMNARPTRAEVFYVGNIGGTAGSPTYAGIRGWNGQRCTGSGHTPRPTRCCATTATRTATTA